MRWFIGIVLTIYVGSFFLPAWQETGNRPPTSGGVAFLLGLCSVYFSVCGAVMLPFYENATATDWKDVGVMTFYAFCWTANLSLWFGILCLAFRNHAMAAGAALVSAVFAAAFPLGMLLPRSSTVDVSIGYYAWLACPIIVCVAAFWCWWKYGIRLGRSLRRS